MSKLVKEAFLLLMMVVVASTLYMILFGYNINGVSWKGVLYSAANALEEPVSQYYYKYCYTPSALQTWATDSNLSGVMVDTAPATSGYKNHYNNIFTIPTDKSVIKFDSYNGVKYTVDWDEPW